MTPLQYCSLKFFVGPNVLSLEMFFEFWKMMEIWRGQFRVVWRVRHNGEIEILNGFRESHCSHCRAAMKRSSSTGEPFISFSLISAVSEHKVRSLYLHPYPRIRHEQPSESPNTVSMDLACRSLNSKFLRRRGIFVPTFH